ncbi:MAG TPA: phosphopantetheine-binding protein [Flavilitoribacter sp.]|nr:hypothetical protein [Lewinella sp.]MCB9279103.1 acyl carrier protein [Lewinellaceae bacterium]HMQ60797.1 phosphopantetheine-binding protein [Flavilitoribacter sp.]HMQ87007.1 phosphopantetheine-binding protein [Flavilitoribacter sp.]
METKTTQDRVIDLISWRLNVPPTRIYPYTRLQDDLLLDALDMMLLIVELESRFNIFLTTEEVEGIETVQDASFLFQKYAA